MFPISAPRQTKATLLEDAEVAWAYEEEFSMWLYLLLWAGFPP
jgi:hypothetical protein